MDKAIQQALGRIASTAQQKFGQAFNTINPLGDTDPQQTGRQNFWTTTAPRIGQQVGKVFTQPVQQTDRQINDFISSRIPKIPEPITNKVNRFGRGVGDTPLIGGILSEKSPNLRQAANLVSPDSIVSSFLGGKSEKIPGQFAKGLNDAYGGMREGESQQDYTKRMAESVVIGKIDSMGHASKGLAIKNKVASQADDVSRYISQQVQRQQGARQTSGIVQNLKNLKGDVKQKFVDETASIGDTLSKAEKQGKFNVLPTRDIRIQIDKTLRSDSIASQFIKDKGFADVIKQVPDTDEFNQYLIAKHASRVGQKGILTGRDAVRDKQLVQALAGKYEPYAKQLRAYQDALLDYKVESGFISKDLANSLRKQYPDYVPLQRIFTELEEETLRPVTGRSGGIASVSTQNVLKRLKGSEREIANPIESILESTGIAVRQGERNKAAQMLISYKDLPGNPFGLVPIRTAENVTKRIDLYSQAKDLRPIQNKLARLLKTRQSWGRSLESELNKLNQQGLYQSLRRKFSEGPEIASSVLQKDVYKKRLVDIGTDKFYAPEMSPRTKLTQKYAIPTKSQFRNIINNLVNTPSDEIRAIKSKIATRENRLGPILDEIASLSDDLQGVKTYRGQLVGEARGLKDQSSFAKNTISAWRNGVKETYETLPEIAEAAKNLDAQQFGLLGQIFAVPTRVLKLGATGVNVPFIASNLVRDQIFSSVTSNRPLSTSLANPKVFGKALFEAIRHGKAYDDWVRAGGSFTSFDISRNAAPQTVAKIRAQRSIPSRIAYTAKSPGEWLRAVENVVGRTEELTRLQQFEGTRRALLAQGRTPQDATLLAQQAANFNTSNFARKGSWSKVVNGVIPFFSAGIAGARSLVRSAQANPGRFAARFVTTIGLPTATATAWNILDPIRKQAYDDISPFEKENNLIIVPPNPVQDEEGKWNVIKIPVTPGLSNLMSIVRRQVEGVHTISPETAFAILGDVVAAGTSINVTDPTKLASTFTPQAVKPGLEMSLNKNLFTGKDIVPFYMKDLPPEEQVYAHTSGTARELGRLFNTSPLMVENTINTSFAGVGRQAINASDRVLNAAGLIPEEQVGGRSIGEDIQSRFTKASGGEVDRQKEKQEIEAEKKLGGGGQSVLAQLFTGKKAEAAASSPIVNNKIKYKDLDGKVQTIDLSPPTKGQGIDAFVNQDWNLAKAREVWKANIPQEDKNKAFEQLGVDPEDVRYDYLANHDNDIKTQYIVSKNLNHDELIKRLISGRVESASGKIFASDGVLNSLRDQGLITPAEAKALKAMDLDKKGKPKAGSGSGKRKKLKVSQFSAPKLKLSKPKKLKTRRVKLTQVKLDGPKGAENAQKVKLKI